MHHSPFMNYSDSCMNDLYIFFNFSLFLLHIIQGDKCFMHGDQLLIKIHHNVSECFHFMKYSCLNIFHVHVCGRQLLSFCLALFYLLFYNFEIIFHLFIFLPSDNLYFLRTSRKGQVSCNNSFRILSSIHDNHPFYIDKSRMELIKSQDEIIHDQAIN